METHIPVIFLDLNGKWFLRFQSALKTNFVQPVTLWNWSKLRKLTKAWNGRWINWRSAHFSWNALLNVSKSTELCVIGFNNPMFQCIPIQDPVWRMYLSHAPTKDGKLEPRKWQPQSSPGSNQLNKSFVRMFRRGLNIWMRSVRWEREVTLSPLWAELQSPDFGGLSIWESTSMVPVASGRSW